VVADGQESNGGLVVAEEFRGRKLGVVGLESERERKREREKVRVQVGEDYYDDDVPPGRGSSRGDTCVSPRRWRRP
jgi:hypothetical protein